MNSRSLLFVLCLHFEADGVLVRSLLRGQSSMRNDLNGTAVVVKLYGDITDWQRHIIDQYSAQLENSGARLAFLRDVSYVAPEETIVRPKTMCVFGSGTCVEVPMCEVTWGAAQQEFGNESMSQPRFDAHQVDDAYHILWWRHCSSALGATPDFVWLVEADAVFNGDIKVFLSSVAHEGADHVASGYALASWKWWKIRSGMWVRSMGQGVAMIRRTSGAVENVPALPTLHVDGNHFCLVDPEDKNPDSEGLLFYQASVQRFSRRLLDRLDRVAAEGIMGPSEAFASSVCALQLGAAPDDTQNCSLFDFAPIESRPSGKTWASPAYCFFPPYDLRAKEHCGAADEWRDRWIHPVKASRADEMECV
mmetsp:Transcript_28696/g.78936  ORF Transcript_28696/g.78936 Transcript_28696/m.78936 type:complete len:364 (-) Transcript_28696:162-1253(-)|eukprot:CAMPEP_0117472300 /NCGR_PEP_ID=MMETSP0784-20121206/8175_1 /TAXON_ID=39447 /ORGANISM="" /LENGTH=363 /DNA_ID=CAMNT_0005266445 /DNA_START=94 /DNA_END=1185 /DNA_ORIENTATION=+